MKIYQFVCAGFAIWYFSPNNNNISFNFMYSLKQKVHEISRENTWTAPCIEGENLDFGVFLNNKIRF